MTEALKERPTRAASLRLLLVDNSSMGNPQRESNSVILDGRHEYPLRERHDVSFSPMFDPEGMSVNSAETVRCEIRDIRGRILLLQKGARSKNSGMFEFPGGKIDKIRGSSSTLEEQRESVIREVLEETEIDISNVPVNKAGSSRYAFEVGGVFYERDVHYFQAQLSEGGYSIKVNQTMTAGGGSEDKHASFHWVTAEEFRELQRDGKIAANSIASIH